MLLVSSYTWYTELEKKYTKNLPAAKCKGVLFLPAVSLAFTVVGVISFRTLAMSPTLQASKSSLRGSLAPGKGSIEAFRTSLRVAIPKHTELYHKTTDIVVNWLMYRIRKSQEHIVLQFTESIESMCYNILIFVWCC